MKLKDILAMSWSSLLKRKVRTFLTVLGVVIGTISIVVMLSLGIGMKNMMLGEMESYGSLKQITVNASNFYYGDSNDNEQKLLDDNFVRMVEGLDHVEMVVPVITASVYIKSGKYAMYTDVIGISPEGIEKLGIPLAEGHLPTDSGKLEFLYGNGIPQYWFVEKTYTYEYWDNGTVPDVDFNEDQMRVIFDMDSYYSAGSQDENGQTIKAPKKYIIPTAGVVQGDIDDYSEYSYNVYCNLDALVNVLKNVYKGKAIPGQPTKKNGKPYKEIFYSTVYVYVDEMESVEEVQGIIDDLGYSTYANAQWIKEDMQIINIIELVLGGIGAVSLFVAAIGITNTMMMSIYERTKEIGIMKVIGCRIRDIQMMFLTEAGFIGFIGGSIGLTLSYILSYTINTLATSFDESMKGISSIPIWLAAAALVFAILIGMISGFVPSLRAMKLSPLSAIRAE